MCDADTKSSSSASHVCLDCGIGEKSKAGSGSCQRCSAGEAGTPCTKCLPGNYRAGSDNDATTCDSCPQGYYQNQQGSGSCLPCIPGRTSNITGAKNCLDCESNTYSSSSASTSCLACVTGRTSDVGSARCSACSSGKHLINGVGSECRTCPSGYSQKKQNQNSCKSCGLFDIGQSSSEGASVCR